MITFGRNKLEQLAFKYAQGNDYHYLLNEIALYSDIDLAIYVEHLKARFYNPDAHVMEWENWNYENDMQQLQHEEQRQ